MDFTKILTINLQLKKIKLYPVNKNIFQVPKYFYKIKFLNKKNLKKNYLKQVQVEILPLFLQLLNLKILLQQIFNPNNKIKIQFN
jgi:hypothetical protein